MATVGFKGLVLVLDESLFSRQNLL